MSDGCSCEAQRLDKEVPGAGVVNELSEGRWSLEELHRTRRKKYWFLLVSSSKFQNEQLSNVSANVMGSREHDFIS